MQSKAERGVPCQVQLLQRKVESLGRQYRRREVSMAQLEYNARKVFGEIRTQQGLMAGMARADVPARLDQLAREVAALLARLGPGATQERRAVIDGSWRVPNTPVDVTAPTMGIGPRSEMGRPLGTAPEVHDEPQSGVRRPFNYEEFLGGRYKPCRSLGGGAQAEVLLAADSHTGSLVALKVYDQLDATARKRCLQEARLSQRIDNRQNIVKIHEVHDIPRAKRMIVVMEYIDGVSLRQLMQRGEVTPAEVYELVRQMCLGLCQIHDLGYVHKDVKPENVMVLRKDGCITFKLVDLGGALALNGPRHTQEDSFFGTPDYMPLEQRLGEPGTARSDLYSLGRVAQEVLLGELADLIQPPPCPAHVDPRFWALLAEMTHMTPNGRPASTRVVLERLAVIEAGAGAVTGHVEAPGGANGPESPTAVPTTADPSPEAPVAVTPPSSSGWQWLDQPAARPASKGDALHGVVDAGRRWTQHLTAVVSTTRWPRRARPVRRDDAVALPMRKDGRIFWATIVAVLALACTGLLAGSSHETGATVPDDDPTWTWTYVAEEVVEAKLER